MKLNFLHVSCLLIFCFLLHITRSTKLEDRVKDIIESFRVRMCHPIPQLKLPILEPYKVDDAKIELDNKYLKNFTASITDFRIDGLSDFIINKIKITPLPLPKFNIELTIPFCQLKSKYTANGWVLQIVQLAGNGVTEAYSKQIDITVTCKLNMGLSIRIKNLKINIKIGDFNVILENFIEEKRINDFVHNVMNEIGVEILNDVWEKEGQIVEKNIQVQINRFLSKYNTNDIISIINGSHDPIFGENPPADCK